MNSPAEDAVTEPLKPWSKFPKPNELLRQNGLSVPFVDSIWRVRGELPLEAPIAADEAFARLDALFQTPGTDCAVDDDTLFYTKRNPAAQDPLATFTRGTLRIEQRGQGTVLRYDLSSTALLLCFLAPLLFLGFAQLAVTANAWEKSSTEASEKENVDKDDDEPKAAKKLNPVDEFLGAPAPDDPNKEKDKDKKKDEGRHSPTPGYALAGLFFAIYLVGRWLEPWLIKRTLRATLLAPAADRASITSSGAPVS